MALTMYGDSITYALHVRCSECGRMHTLPLVVRRAGGPRRKCSLEHFYAGAAPPANIHQVTESFRCPRTDKVVPACTTRITMMPLLPRRTYGG